MPDTAPLKQKLTADVPAATIAAAAVTTVGEAPFAGTVSEATLTFEANVTGHDTDKRTFTLVNKGADGNGTTVVATLDLVAGVNALDFDEKPMTLSVVADATDVAAGDVLALVEAVAGSGLVNPGAALQVVITRG